MNRGLTVRRICTASTLAAVIGLTLRPAHGQTSPEVVDQIAYISSAAEPPLLALMDADGGNQMMLSSTFAGALAWSPDGTRLAYTSGAGLFVVPASGGTPVHLVYAFGLAYGGDLAWSPDGTKIAFTDPESIFVVSAAGGQSLYLGYGRTVAWSPDSTKIAFPSPHDFQLYAVNADGSGRTRLTTGVFALGRPAWSPDGARIAFTCMAAPQISILTSVCAVDADGSAFRPLTGSSYTSDPVWAPDGSRIAFVAATGAPTSCPDYTVTDLAVMNADGSGVRLLGAGTGEGVVGHPAWSPDGERIAFTDSAIAFGDFGNGAGYWCSELPSVSVIDRDGTGAASLAAGYKPAWRPTLAPAPTNIPPTPWFTFTCISLTCDVDASGSSDVDGTVVSHAWAFGDATTASGATVSHTYAMGGTYPVTLIVTDNRGATGTHAQSVTVVPPGMHVADLDPARTIQSTRWTATVTIAVHDGSHRQAANTTVSGSWSNGGPGSCTTNVNAQCHVSRSGIPRKTGSVTFVVTSLARAPFLYEPADNHDPDGDSNGSTITITRQ